MNHEFHDIVEQICEKDLRYGGDAYEFVMLALNFTQKKLKRSKHVTGKELLRGMKELLLRKYGPMALTLLNHWGVKRTEDIGNIVFNLVENKVLSKSDEDSIENFRNGFDFTEVFDKGYRKQLERRVSRMTAW